MLNSVPRKDIAMSVKFLTDSACDMLPKEAAALGVTCIPIQITINDVTYEDAVTITHQEFYEKLAASEKLPVTSQINPMIYADYYERLTENGDEVVVICLSSALSGTYQNAVMAAEDFPGKVFVVDSLSATSGQIILIQRGLELAAQGLSAAQIAQALEEEKKKIHVVALVDTLEYLKKGGRISPTVALAGGLLGIKPAIEVKDGSVVMAGTARGLKKGHELTRSLIEKYGGIDWSKPMSLIYSGDDSMLRKFMETTHELWDGHGELPIHSLGGTIGTHIGPNAYGIAFFEK